MITLTRGRDVPGSGPGEGVFTTLGDGRILTRTEEGLTRRGGFLRAQLAGRLKLRIAPELRFHSRRFGRARRAPVPVDRRGGHRKKTIRAGPIGGPLRESVQRGC